MSGAQAKAARRLTEALAQAHDRLHKDDVEGCHELLHQAMGTGRVVSNVAPITHVAGFDSAFRELCIRYRVQAGYVLVDPATTVGTRFLSGGDARVDALVTRGVRMVLDAMEKAAAE